VLELHFYEPRFSFFERHPERLPTLKFCCIARMVFGLKLVYNAWYQVAVKSN